MALSPERIRELREQYAVPEQGYSRPNSRLIEELRSGWGINDEQSMMTDEEVDDTEDDGALKIFGKGVKDSFVKRTDEMARLQEEGEAGKINPLSEFFQTGGEAAGMLGDIMFEAMKLLAPKSVEEKAGDVMEDIGSSEAIQALAGKWAEFKEKHPEAAGNLEAAGNIGSLIPIGKGAQLGVKGIKEGTESAIKTTVKGTEKAIDASKKGVEGVFEKTKSWMQEGVPANVETVLKETPTEQFDNYVSIAQEAVKNPKAITPLEQAGKRAQEALDTINRKTKEVGRQKAAVLSKAAVGRKPVGNIAVKFRAELRKALANKTTVEGDTKLVQDVLEKARALGDNPNATDVDKFIDFVQDRIYTGERDLSVPITDGITGIIRRETGKLNGALKAQLPDSYKNLNAEFARLIEIRNELNVKLGKEGEKGGALMKRVFSPSDARTKELFADVLKETKVDLVNEATIARYVMDILGDARQKSMLQQLQLLNTKPTPGNILSQLVEYAKQSANTPEELIKRAREITTKGISEIQPD